MVVKLGKGGLFEVRLALGQVESGYKEYNCGAFQISVGGLSEVGFKHRYTQSVTHNFDGYFEVVGVTQNIGLTVCGC